METTKKRIAIIGAGVSGLSAVIAMKEEGMEPVCFEKQDKPGGTWCYKEQSTPGYSSIMPTTIINHSKEIGAFSNFPPDKTYNNYMKHNEVYKYLTSYWTEKGALNHVRYNSQVVEVKPAPDYDDTGRWVVVVQDLVEGTYSSDIYDGVVVCNGFLTFPKMPTYEGQEKFQGQIIHSHDLKHVTGYQGKKVVVVGMGCSGLDAAVEISNVAEKVYLSTRSGAYVMHRTGPNGYPIDSVLLRRYYTFLIDIIPTNLLSWLIEIIWFDRKFHSSLYAVQPQWHVLSKALAINDHFHPKILSGAIVLKKDVLEFSENGVIFDGDSDVTEVDAVVLATGYRWKCPFLEDNILKGDNNALNLYKYIWPVHLKHPTMAFVGYIMTLGPLFPAMEMQCRYIAQVLAGKVKLPSMSTMLKDTVNRKKQYDARFSPNLEQPCCVDYVQYVDEIAKEINAKPNFIKLLFTDPYLLYKIITGPCLAYQYRLQGPHVWPGAREAIMSSNERIKYPLQQTKVKRREPFYVELLRKILLFILPNPK